MKTILALGAALLVCAAIPHRAAAQPVPDCESLPGPRVYIQAGDTQEPLLKALGQKLRNSVTTPITIIYKTSGSCTNIEAFYNQTPISTNALYVPSTAEDAAWTTSTPSRQCTLSAPQAIDIGNSATFVSSCNPNPPPADVVVVRGPEQAYVLAVPENSTQVAISAEQAYFVFGFPNGGEVAPWVNDLQKFIRTATKSTILTWAAAINVPAGQWKGVKFDKSSEVVGALNAAGDAEVAIGILGAEIYDKNRATMNALAFRAYGQTYAYYPDSTPNATDKKNVRDGHYTVWAPTVYFYRKDVGGNPIDPNAKKIVDLIMGFTISPAADFNALQVVVKQGLIPDCAMRVQRSSEGGELSLYDPAEPCGCFFDKEAGGSTTCTPCTDNGPCNGGVCRLGFCEKK